MKREEVYKEIESLFGVVPGFFKLLPESSLEYEWKSFRKTFFDEGAIPNKYRELIALGGAAVGRCKYCVYYHAAVAKLHGATDEEIEEAIRVVKTSNGWSTYINGMQMDYEEFKKEVDQAVEYVSGKQVVHA